MGNSPYHIVIRPVSIVTEHISHSRDFSCVQMDLSSLLISGTSHGVVF